MANFYIAQLLVAYEADGPGESCDKVFAIMSENLLAEGIIKEWSYALNPDTGKYSAPRLIKGFDQRQYVDCAFPEALPGLYDAGEEIAF